MQQKKKPLKKQMKKSGPSLTARKKADPQERPGKQERLGQQKREGKQERTETTDRFGKTQKRTKTVRIPQRDYGAKPKKREWVAGVSLFAILIGFLFRIPLGRIAGDAGLGFFAPAMELYTVLCALLLYGMSRSVAVLVRYRMKREMYKSARRVYKTALFLCVLLGVLLAAGVLFFAETIASVGILERMSYLALAAAAPAVFFSAVMGVLRGYFQGMGTMVPTAHSRILHSVVFLASGLLLGSAFYRYGGRVAGLLRNVDYASAYGAMGAALGLSLAGLLAALHLFLIYAAYSGTFKQQLFKDGAKYVESRGQIVAMLLSTALPYVLCAVFYNVNYLVDQRIFNYAINIRQQGVGRVALWGVYYGKYTAVVGILSVLCVMAAGGAIPKLVQAFERQEYREAQVRLEKTAHRLMVLAIPCAVLLAVLAEPVAGVLFTGDIKTATALMQAGSSVIVFFALTWLFMSVLQRIRKFKTVIFGGMIAFALHLIVVSLLALKTDLGILSVACGSIAFYLAAAAVGFFGVTRYMKYSQEWIRSFLLPLIAAAVSGVIGLLLEKVLLTPAGYLITLAVCLPMCIVIYNVLLMLLKGVNREELEGLPGGRMIATVAEKLRLL